MSLMSAFRKIEANLTIKSAKDKPISFVSSMSEHATNRRCSECLARYGVNYTIQRARYYGYSKNTQGGPDLSSKRTLCSAHKEMLHNVTTISAT